MKVLHLIDSGGLYGAERMLLALVAEQIKQGLEPMILSAGEQGIHQKPLEIEAEKLGLPFVVWRMTPGLNYSETRKICEWAEHWGVDLVHSHGYKFNILMSLFGRFSRKVPVVSTLHGYVHARRFSRMWVYELLDRLAISRLDGVVMVGAAMKKELSTGLIRPRRLTTIRNGLPVDDTQRKASEPLPEALEEFFSTHEQVILGVGRLSNEKGFSHLIDSFRVIKQSATKAGLLIVGDGMLRKDLEDQVARLGLGSDVCLPGYCDNVPALMARSSALVISSSTEGLPITLLEAMAVRLPVVSTDVGEIPFVLDEGDSGVLVTDPASELVDAIELVLNETEATHRKTEHAFHKVSGELSARSMAEQYLRVYNGVVAS
ncbi:glycosyltransferase [Marinobacter sp. VGCF2001]|uniref:glycosyltransferase n=1 Tax=Marinobacter sp. VGCF2001 TaxID=3417189 RepID=UPI003CF9AA2A